MGRFDELLKLAGNFVEKQKGIWDHNAWTNFLSDAQTKGLKINQDIEGKLGATVETMRKYYSVVANPQGITNVLSDIGTKTSEFIKKTNGNWDHNGWEKYVSDLRGKGHSLTDETLGYVGAILEASKQLYMHTPKDDKKDAHVDEKMGAPDKTPKTKTAVTPTESTAPVIKSAPKSKTKGASDTSNRVMSPSSTKKK